jgi:uncharacterized protein (DUF427 family)
MANSGPGYAKNPEHRVHTAPAGERVRITFQGELIADSTRAVRLEEGKYPPTFYVPREDVKMDRLRKTAHSTYCPFKGDASYFTIRGNADAENAVWSYEAPYDEVLSIREHLAFYPNKVDSIVAG